MHEAKFNAVDRTTRRLQASIPTYVESAVARFAPQLLETAPDQNAVPARSAELLSKVKPAAFTAGMKLSKLQKSAQEEIGVIVYISGHRIEIKLEAHVLSRVMHSPDPALIRPLLDSLWVYLWSTASWGPTYGVKMTMRR